MNKFNRFYLSLLVLAVGGTAVAASIDCNQYGNPITIQNCRNLQVASEFGKQKMLSDFNNAMANQNNPSAATTPGPQRAPAYILPNALPPTPNLNPPSQLTRPVRHYY